MSKSHVSPFDSGNPLSNDLRPCRWCGVPTSEVSQLCKGICQEEFFGETRAEHEDEEPESCEDEDA